MEVAEAYYEDLPTIMLTFQDQKYSLFSPSDKDMVCLFGSDYKPETIDIPLEEGDQYNTILFDSPLYYTLLELKNFLGIEKADVTLEFPSLDISLHQDLSYVETLTMYELYSMHSQLMGLDGVGTEEMPLFEIVVQKVSLC
jgi:hypothetical protein